MVTWKEGWAFLQFLQHEGLPDSLYYNADNDDKKAIEDIQALSTYYVLRDDNGSIQQVLIPLSEELQAHIYKSQGQYFLENIPIEYQTLNKNFVIRINSSSVYNEIKNATKSTSVASFFVKTLKDRVNFRQDIHKGSIVGMLYKRKFRLGYPFGEVDLKLALLQTGSIKRYVVNFDGKNYSENGDFVEKSELMQPLKSGTYRISSRFTKKRWHPILKKYRAHLGIDYAAPRGTPIYSAGDGTIVFIGVSRGYGNLIKIKHKEGYLTLYAHLKSFGKGLKRGSKVSKGDFIARVGTTGLSTGPHLHFGLYKDGVALNPETTISINTKMNVSKDQKKEFLSYKNSLINQLDVMINDFKIGMYQTEEYQYNKLFCEAGISNFEIPKSKYKSISPFENDLIEKREQKAINGFIEDSEFSEEYYQYYVAPEFDKLELSEDYQEF
jgi:murein DD-endopeptidase MepM/ murein hydrolase activator NlpD